MQSTNVMQHLSVRANYDWPRGDCHLDRLHYSPEPKASCLYDKHTVSDEVSSPTPIHSVVFCVMKFVQHWQLPAPEQKALEHSLIPAMSALSAV